jgi:alpha-1,6-mannosyltransferase
MLAVLAGILLLLNGRPARGGAAMVAAAGMKATALVIVPFAVIGSSDRRRALLGAIVTGAALVAVSLAVFGTVVPSLGPQTTLVSPLGALNLLGLVLGFGGATTGMQVIAQVVLVVVIGYLLWRTWRGADWMDMAGWAVFALLLSLSWVVPWYVMWLLPLAALSASRSLKRATLAVTLLLFVTSLPATALLLADEVGWYPDHTKLGKHHSDEIQRYLK